MIIFGIRTKRLKSKELSSYDCEYCHSKKTVTFSFLASYFHIFWIPIFPTSKKGISQCSHCKQVLYANEMTPNMKHGYATASANSKRPITHYFGLIVIGFCVCAIIYGIMKNSANEAEYLANPKIDDVYRVERNDIYTFYKLSEIKGDTLFFNVHNKAVERSADLYDLKKKFENDYSDETIKFTKKQVEAMKDNSKSDFGKIYGIERD